MLSIQQFDTQTCPVLGRSVAEINRQTHDQSVAHSNDALVAVVRWPRASVLRGMGKGVDIFY